MPSHNLHHYHGVQFSRYIWAFATHWNPLLKASINLKVKQMDSFELMILGFASCNRAHASICLFLCREILVGQSGLEPLTSRLSVVCSSQLSYWPVLVEISGIEPLTSCLQGRRSPSWAKPPSSRASLNRSAPSKLNNKKPIKALCTDLRTLPNLLQIGSSP